MDKNTQIILKNKSIRPPAKLMHNKNIKIPPNNSPPFLSQHEACLHIIVCGACLHWLLRPDKGQGGRPLRAEAEETRVSRRVGRCHDATLRNPSRAGAKI